MTPSNRTATAVPQAPSTINQNVLKTLPVQEAYRYGSEGSGCFLDPPGYPSYFARPVYDGYGNQPNNAPYSVIFDETGTARVLVAWNATDAQREKILRDLWVPLPYNHPRTQAWINSIYAYFRNMWRDPLATNNNADKLIAYPARNVFLSDGLGRKWNFGGGTYLIKRVMQLWATDVKGRKQLTEMYKKAITERKQAGRENAALLQHIKAVVSDPENYRAGQYIRQFYPEHQTNTEYIKNPPAWGAGGSGDWWEREEITVTPETCPMSTGGRAGGHKPFLPVGKDAKNWCQFCGWVNPWRNGKPEEVAEGEKVAG